MYFAGSFKEFIRYVDIGPLTLAEVSLGVDSGRGVLFASWPLENRGQVHCRHT